MPSMRTRAAGAVAQAMSVLPVAALRQLELAAQLGQGKGWGTATVDREVKAALALMGPLPSPFVVADIGANVGDWTDALLRAAPTAQVDAFEPGTAAFAALDARLGRDQRVRLHRCAVGREIGTATLWSDASGSMLASLEKRRLDHRGISFEHREDVEVTTIDSVFVDRDAPQLIKIDVEGRELDVLMGATAVLHRARVVQFEFGGCNIDTRTYMRDFWDFFAERGFQLYCIGPRGPRRLRTYSEQNENFMTTNFVAARDAR